MAMNKRGFLKILESIVAIVILLGFVVALMPSKPKSQAKLPPDLDQTTSSILKEMQESPEFRKCVLGVPTNYFGDSIGAECVYKYIEFLTKPKAAHAWNYAVDVCKLESDSVTCDTSQQAPAYTFASDPTATPPIAAREDLPIDKNIYIRATTISVEDVLGEGATGEPIVITNPLPGQEQEDKAGTRYIITLFAWSKS